MQSFNFKTRLAAIVCSLLFCFSADIFAQQSKDFSEINSAKIAEFSQASIAGSYDFNSHRKNRGGFETSLVIEQSDDGKLRVSFEGAYFYLANGEETFHESTAQGVFTIKGATANGKLIEEGSENTCSARLAFLNETVTLTSSKCDLNISPDATYKKAAAKSNAEVSLRAVPKPKKQSAHGKNQPFIEYDEDGKPDAVLNLMKSPGEREGCAAKESIFTGKLLTLDDSEEFVYEFTLADANRKRQKISLIITADDKLPSRDLHSILKVGANLTVKYLNCGNAPIASPTAIYRK